MKWFLILMMVLHGIIHLMGGFSELGLAEVEGTVRTLFYMSDNIKFMLGFVWILATILFLVTPYGFASGKKWWKQSAIVSVVVSQVLVILWWPDAKFGTIPNIITLLGVFCSKQGK